MSRIEEDFDLVVRRYEDKLEELEIENARLRAALKPFQRLLEENARLRAALKPFQRLLEENEKLRAALKPFAEYEYDDMDDDEDETASPFILVKHLRAAAAALKETGDGER